MQPAYKVCWAMLPYTLYTVHRYSSFKFDFLASVDEFASSFVSTPRCFSQRRVL